MREKSAAVIVQ